MAENDHIDLAHAPAFVIGTVEVLPSTREVVGADGARDVIEPRVMQVLVALARAQGAIVSRDDLTRSCWEGRVVGEDAINRVISRLRRVAEGPGAGSFRIETVTKVGYRLVAEGAAVATMGSAPGDSAAPPGKTEKTGSEVDRRWLIGAATAAAALGGGALWWRGAQSAPAPKAAKPPQVAALFEQGVLALRLTSNAGNQQACGLFRRATELAPDDPDVWGALGLAYAIQRNTGPPDMTAESDAQARSAIARARSLEATNPWAEAATGYLYPRRGHWAERRDALEKAAKGLPLSDLVLIRLSDAYAGAGYMTKAMAALQPLYASGLPSNFVHYHYGLWLWGAGRLAEADRVIDQGLALYPLNFALWFLRFYVFCHSGRASTALAMATDERRLPTDIPKDDIDHVTRFAQLMQQPDATKIGPFLAEAIARAHQGTGYAENAMQFAAALGQPDIAFAAANALFFDRGFSVPAIRFGKSRGYYSHLEDRRTFWLFLPSTAAMRRDPRFGALIDELGLSRYWASVREQPDYRTR